MKLRPFHCRKLALGVLIAGLTATPALAAPPALATTTPAPPIDTSWCTEPLLSEPFAAAGDANQYMLVPGQSPDNFDGTGWTLTGGAQIVTTTLADGTTSSVLDLPAGSAAISPNVCVQEDYPDARAMVRDVAGSGGLSFEVSYQGRPSWDSPQATGRLHGKKTTGTCRLRSTSSRAGPRAGSPSASSSNRTAGTTRRRCTTSTSIHG